MKGDGSERKWLSSFLPLTATIRFCSVTILYFIGIHSIGTNANEEQATTSTAKPACRLWLGPSYLSSESAHKFGLYAGIDYEENDIIPDFEPGFPILDFLKYPASQTSKLHRETMDYLQAMMWSADYAGTAKWEANASTSVLIPGVGILANYHNGFYNIDWNQPSVIGREPYIPSRVAMAARGSITPYYNFTVKATRKIPAGMELFSKFGDVYNSDNTESSNDVYQDKFTRTDYVTADKVLDRILDFFEKYDGSINTDLQESILDFMLDNVLDGTAGKRAKVYRSLLPPSTKKLKLVKKYGGTFQYRYRDMIRTSDWLEKFALCVDTLEVKPSTIPHAGRGAFARRKFIKGDIISPLPLIPVPAEEIFQLYNAIEVNDGTKTELVFDTSTPSGFQQILNYAYGHYESTLHLLPVAPTVNFINHGSDRSPPPNTEDIIVRKPPNAFLDWSTHEHVYNDHTLHDIPLNEWTIGEVPSIVMMLTALRDIEEGEEILFDYGHEWERSWDNHMIHWQNTFNRSGTTPIKWPLRAIDVMQLYKEKPYPYNILVGQTPYPEGVVSGANLGGTPSDVQDGQPRQNEQGLDILVWKGPADPTGLTGQHVVVCDIVDRKPIYDDNDKTTLISYNYTILTRLKSGDDNQQNLVQIENVPHFAITLLDRPYTSDIHAPGAFRHWIAVRDGTFPQVWRNLR